jgi:hypothetical protein
MSKFTQPARSVRDIKTLAGKSDDLHTPHKVYMRLFALETERHRRQQERASAMARVSSIDIRCAEIDMEKAELLAIRVDALPAELAGTTPTPGALQVPPAAPRAQRNARRASATPAAPGAYETVKIRY